MRACAAVAFMAFAAGGAVQAATAGSPPDAATWAQIDALIQKTQHDMDVPGIAIAIVDGNRIVHEKASGFSDLGRQTPYTARTIVYAASVTKTMTAAALLQQVDAGRIKLDDAVTTYLPYFGLADDPRAKAITVRQLLNGASCLPNIGRSFGNGKGELEEEIRYFSTTKGYKLACAPGTGGWAYPNYGALVAGLIVQTVAHQPFADYVEEHIFRPLGMTSSSMHSWRTELLGGTKGYVPAVAGGHVVRTILDVGRALGPTGGSLSSAEDLAKFAIAMMHGGTGANGHSILTPANVAAIWQPQVAARSELDRAPIKYGLGWELRDLGGLHFVTKAGSLGTTTALVVTVPDRKLAVIMTANEVSYGAATLPFSIVRMMTGATPLPMRAMRRPPAPPKSGVARKDAGVSYESLVGTYRPDYLQVRRPIRVFLDGDELKADIGLAKGALLEPLGGRRFLTIGDGWDVTGRTFEFRQAGGVTTIVEDGDVVGTLESKPAS